MIILIVFAFFLGIPAGATLLWKSLPQRLKHHIDYRERWENAITLLGEQGQLTPEQVRSIRDGLHPLATAAGVQLTVRAEPMYAPIARPGATRTTLRVLHEMASWDRRDAEIARARRGLPPLDDLIGMASWDQRDVMKARTEYETGRG